MYPLYRTLLRFLVAGGAATGVHFASMHLMLQGAVDALSASAMGALLGAITNYLLQYRWTFRSVRAHRDAIAAFLLVSLLSWILNVAFFACLHRVAGLSPWPAQLLTTGLLTLTNYHLYRTRVFT